MHPVDVQPPLLQRHLHLGFRARAQGLCYSERLHFLRGDCYVLSVHAVPQLSHGRTECHDILAPDCSLLLPEAGEIATALGGRDVLLRNLDNSPIYQHDGSGRHTK